MKANESLAPKVIYSWRFLVCGMLLLTTTACGKTIQFEEEVELQTTSRKIVVKRREIFEMRVDRLDLKQVRVRLEFQVPESTIPVWSENLVPMYLDEVSGGQRYVLVTTIQSTMSCYERGRPNSPYVVYEGDAKGWREIPAPKYLEGREANLLSSATNKVLGDKPLSIRRIQELNRLSGLSGSDKTILLNSKFGC